MDQNKKNCNLRNQCFEFAILFMGVVKMRTVVWRIFSHAHITSAWLTSCISSFIMSLPVSKSVHSKGVHLNPFIITSFKPVFCFTWLEVHFSVLFLLVLVWLHVYVVTLTEMYTSITPCTHASIYSWMFVVILSCTEEEMSLSDLSLVRWLINLSLRAHTQTAVCVPLIFQSDIIRLLWGFCFIL